MLDTKGPEIRTGELKDHKSIDLVKGQTLEISFFPMIFKKLTILIATDYTFQGDSTRIACSYQSLPKYLKYNEKTKTI